MKWYHVFLIFAGLFFTAFLIYCISSQNETLLFIGCLSYSIFIMVFFALTYKMVNKEGNVYE